MYSTHFFSNQILNEVFSGVFNKCIVYVFVRKEKKTECEKFAHRLPKYLLPLIFEEIF